VVDFFNFDSSAGAHSADGTGRTCANHVAANYAGIDFDQWWVSQPRANFNDGLDASITDALDNALFPNYLSTPKWAVTNVGCGKVKFTATIPTVNLIATGASDCTAVRCSRPQFQCTLCLPDLSLTLPIHNNHSPALAEPPRLPAV
jgi:hypothetical protein